MTSRPTTATTLAPDAIPPMLRDLPRWILWRYERRNGDWTKVPYQPDGAAASSTNADTWSTFAVALAACQRAAGRYDGLGIVLNGDGLAALDYDHCIADDGTIAPDVLADLAALGTYAERSPSGRGVRAFVVADLPFTGRKRGDFEAYATARYMTVTGDRLADQPDTIADGGDALARILATRLPERTQTRPATVATSRPTTATTLAPDDAVIVSRVQRTHDGPALWRGDIPAHLQDDDSRADLALCSLLVYCGAPDAETVARLVASSGLHRDKWNRDDYRERTIARAFANQHDRWSDAPRAVVAMPSGATQPQERGAIFETAFDAPCGETVAALRARIADLEAERDRLRADRDRERERADHNGAMLSAVRVILANGELGAARLTGAAVAVGLAARERNEAERPADGMYPMTAAETGRLVGVNAATASRHMRQIAAMPDSPLRRELRTIATETVDRDTGEITTTRRQWTFIGMNAANVTDFASGLARLEAERRHGGARTALACPEHPAADLVKRSAWSVHCSDCDRTITSGETVQRIPAASLAAPDGDTRLQDAIGTDDGATVVDVTPSVHLAIGGRVVARGPGYSVDFEPATMEPATPDADCIMQPGPLATRIRRGAIPRTA